MPFLKSIGKYALSLSILAAIFYLIDANDIVAAMATVDPAAMAVAVGLALGSQFFSAIRLHRLAVLQEIVLGFSRVLVIGLSAVFYGLVVPAGTVAAFAVRFIQLSRNARMESVAATLVVDRALATVSLVAIGVLAFALDQSEPWWAAIILAGAVVVAGAVVFGRRVYRSLMNWLEQASDGGVLEKTHGALRRITGAFGKFSGVDRQQLVVVIAATLAAHLCGCLVYIAVAKSLGLDLALLSICWIRSGMILAAMIPLSVAGLGLRELAAIALIVPLGIVEAQAVAFSILVFLVTPFAVGLVGGVVELSQTLRSN